MGAPSLPDVESAGCNDEAVRPPTMGSGAGPCFGVVCGVRSGVFGLDELADPMPMPPGLAPSTPAAKGGVLPRTTACAPLWSEEGARDEDDIVLQTDPSESTRLLGRSPRALLLAS